MLRSYVPHNTKRINGAVVNFFLVFADLFCCISPLVSHHNYQFFRHSVPPTKHSFCSFGGNFLAFSLTVLPSEYVS